MTSGLGCWFKSRLRARLSCMSKCPWARYWTPHCTSVRALRWAGDLSREYPALALRQGWDWLQQQHPATPWKVISGYGQWHDMTCIYYWVTLLVLLQLFWPLYGFIDKTEWDTGNRMKEWLEWQAAKGHCCEDKASVHWRRLYQLR